MRLTRSFGLSRRPDEAIRREGKVTNLSLRYIASVSDFEDPKPDPVLPIFTVGEDSLPPLSDAFFRNLRRFSLRQGSGGHQAISPKWIGPRGHTVNGKLPSRGIFTIPHAGDPKGTQLLVDHIDKTLGLRARSWPKLTFVDLRMTSMPDFRLDGRKHDDIKFPNLAKGLHGELVQARNTDDWRVAIRVETAYETRTIHPDDSLVLGLLPGYNPDRKTHDYDDAFGRLVAAVTKKHGKLAFEAAALQAKYVLEALAGRQKGMVLRARRPSGYRINARLWNDHDELLWQSRNMGWLVILGESGHDNISVVSDRQRQRRASSTWPDPDGPEGWRARVQWIDRDSDEYDGIDGALVRSEFKHRWQITAIARG